MRTYRLSVRLWTLVLILLLSCWANFSEATQQKSSYLVALNSISAQELQSHIEYLADDFLEGRESGEKGGQKAGDYLMAQLERLQIKGAGVDGQFTQPFGSNYRNILGIIEGSDPELKNEIIVVCAHYDHVGYGTEENSAGPVGQIHNGADDNASGVAALLELAGALRHLPKAPRRSIMFAFWDAEEREMLGSRHWVAEPTLPLKRIVTVINLDMIGRLRDNRLTVYGTRSGFGLRRLLSQQNEDEGFSIDFSWELEDDSDHYAFFDRGIPVLFLHTGIHDDFHSPYDDANLINTQGLQRVTRLVFHSLCDFGNQSKLPGFRQASSQENEPLRKQLASHVPKLPDRFGVQFGRKSTRQSGIKISRVTYNSPAAKAGLRRGDNIVEFAGNEVLSEEQLTSSILLAEHQVPVVVRRGNRAQTFDIAVELDGNAMRLGITWREDDAEPGTIILTNVVTGSPAANAGLRTGDRIYQVDSQDFADGGSFFEMISTPSSEVTFLVERDGQLHTVVLHFLKELPNHAA